MTLSRPVLRLSSPVDALADTVERPAVHTVPPPKPLRVAIVSEGTYPYFPGGVSLWCHELISGMPEHEFVVAALAVDGSEHRLWEPPDNLAEVVDIPLWGRSPRRRRVRHRAAMADCDAFAALHTEFLESLLLPVDRQGGPASDATDRFLLALHGLFGYAQQADLGRALRTNDAVTRLLATWEAAGLDVAAGRMSLHNAVATNDRIEHLLRPLSYPPLQVDLCHLAMNGLSALVGLASKWRYGTPLMLTEHGVYLRERYLGLDSEGISHPANVVLLRLHRALACAGYAAADVLTPHSEYNRRWQLYNGADSNRMRTMYNGIDPESFPVAESEPDVPTIVYVGRIDPLKDLHTLIRGFAIVNAELPGARLRMFGPVTNPQYLATCQRLIAELELGSAVVFEGRIPDQADAYQAGHVVALTSVSEGFPYTVVESMATGKPQVCTNVGGVSEAVGDAGFVVPARDYQAVAGACLRLLTDDRLRRRLGRRARQRVLDSFTRQQWTDAYRGIYRELAGVRR